MIAFSDRDEAERFVEAFTQTFGGGFADPEIVIDDMSVVQKEDRYFVAVYTNRLKLPKRVVAFVLGWIAAAPQPKPVSFIIPQPELYII